MKRIGQAVCGAALVWALTSMAVAAEPVLPTDAAGWSQAATRDIAEAYDAFAANHPGMYDPNNPGFPAQLAQARSEGLALAGKVTDAASYAAALQGFSTVLQDGHAQAFAGPDVQAVLPKPRWPGFIAAWRGEGLYVYRSEDGGPTRGAEIVSCDGVAMRDLILRNVLTFRGRKDEPGNWWSQARMVFVDSGNPFITLPTACVFASGGQQVTQTLTWRDSDDSYKVWREASYNGDFLPVGTSEPRPGLLWVAMPTFNPDEAQRDAYRKMFVNLNDERGRYLGARAVVLDLRNNQGGSSEWSWQVAQALWGKGRVERIMEAYSADTHVWWRASRDNAAYLGAMVAEMRAQQRTEMADEFGPLVAGIQAASDRGDTWYVQPETDDTPSAPPSEDLEAFTAPVYVIVPGQCASACLDALDVFTRFDNVKLIGTPSSADTTYLEVRQAILPSGLAKAVIPNKMYVGRPRASGQVYTPAIVNTDLDWSTESFVTLVEDDLRR